MNPLFSNDNDTPKPHDNSYLLSRPKGRTIQPLQRHIVDADDDEEKPAKTPHSPAPVPTPTPTVDDPEPAPPERNAAVELIRRKLDAIYSTEPDAEQEVAEVTAPAAPGQRSRHQQFMYGLTTSGKSLAQIQTEWHNYYVRLSDHEKHQVWQEFYALNSRQATPYSRFVTQQPAPQPPASLQPSIPAFPQTPLVAPEPQSVVVTHAAPTTADHQAPTRKKAVERRSVAQLKKRVLRKVQTNAKVQQKAKQHLQSLAFGIGTGVIVLAVLLFSFFNEVIIAPFIQPSRHVSATPIIMNSDSVAASETPEVIVPKINVQIPVVYGQSSITEEDIQRSLEDGVIHYPTTVMPGQQGNAAFFGHSSNNIFNKGKYKFAFVKLHELVPGDVFHLTYDKKVYSYRVFDKKVVEPTEISVLNSVPGKTATAALITCDPPGTSLRRLVVWGEQISPDPATDAKPATTPTVSNTQPESLPSEGPTLWGRLRNWLF